MSEITLTSVNTQNKTVKKIFVCHDSEIIMDILDDPTKSEFDIIFVGNKPISNNLLTNYRIIIARNLKYNIEEQNDLLTFTAWYAIIKNNLFREYEYLCILEYDVVMLPEFQESLYERCLRNEDDIISFLPTYDFFFWDIKTHVLKFFLKIKNVDFQEIGRWYCTSNHCMKRYVLCDFVDWYYPDLSIIKKLDPKQISWYHERLFASYVHDKKYSVYEVEGLIHDMTNSHSHMHSKYAQLPENLIQHYMNYHTCEFLNKFIEKYDVFLELNKHSFEYRVGSYLFNGHEYTYDETLYEKQLLLFTHSKNAKNILLIGNYMSHILLIIYLANPNANIICIDNDDYNTRIFPSQLLCEKFDLNFIHITQSSNITDNINILKQLEHDFDLIHISQQYPCRENLISYMDICLKKTKFENLKFIIDDYDVYSYTLFDTLRNTHIFLNENCANCIHRNAVIEFKKYNYKKYFLIYDDGTENFKCHIEKLVNTIQKYSDFKIITFNKNEIDKEFVQENSSILNQPRGDGYWLWKPYIISKTLSKINNNDLLFYIDSKYYFTEPFENLYSDIIDNKEQDMVIWRNKPNEPSYLLRNWCKMDVIQKYNMYNDVFMHNTEACWAGALIIRKTQNSAAIIDEWLKMSCCDDITDRPSTIPNNQDFIEHRHDQSLLSILVKKYNIKLYTFEKKYLQNVRQPY
jgi:hypothetical protein